MPRHSPRAAREEVRRQRAEGREPSFRYEWKYLCGTLYEMPTVASLESLVADAQRAVEFAQQVRQHHARRSRKGNKQRETDIKVALDGLAKAMKPIRSRLGRVAYEPYADMDLIREASEDIQRERRKLWKMRKRRPAKAKPQTAPAPEPEPEEPKFEPREQRVSRTIEELRELLRRAENGDD